MTTIDQNDLIIYTNNMKKYCPAILLLLFSLISFSCASDDDESETLRNIEGTVEGISACNTNLGDLAYQIIPSNFDGPQGLRIITATLPKTLSF